MWIWGWRRRSRVSAAFQAFSFSAASRNVWLRPGPERLSSVTSSWEIFRLTGLTRSGEIWRACLASLSNLISAPWWLVQGEEMRWCGCSTTDFLGGIECWLLLSRFFRPSIPTPFCSAAAMAPSTSRLSAENIRGKLSHWTFLRFASNLNLLVMHIFAYINTCNIL